MAVVAELWRYPVKSMRGECLTGTPIAASGIPGDRRWALARNGRLVTARNDPSLLNRPPSPLDELPYELVEDPAGIFDTLPLHLVNLASVAALASTVGGEVDHRRFRANAYLTGLEAYEERWWPRRRLRLGTSLLQAVQLCARCVVMTLHPDTLEPAPELLRAVEGTQGGTFGILCRVVEPGYVAEGDACELA